MHIGPIPQQPVTQFAVMVLCKAVRIEGQDLYHQVGTNWPSLAVAQAFRQSYEMTNPHIKGKTVVVEKTTTWTVISDYDAKPKIPTQRMPQESFADTPLRGR